MIPISNASHLDQTTRGIRHRITHHFCRQSARKTLPPPSTQIIFKGSHDLFPYVTGSSPLCLTLHTPQSRVRVAKIHLRPPPTSRYLQHICSALAGFSSPISPLLFLFIYYTHRWHGVIVSSTCTCLLPCCMASNGEQWTANISE